MTLTAQHESSVWQVLSSNSAGLAPARPGWLLSQAHRTPEMAERGSSAVQGAPPMLTDG